MNNLKNSVQLIGHLGADPEMKTLESGALMAKIRVATTDNYKNNKGEWVSDTQWHHCTLWEGLAERAKNYLKKGSHLIINGKLMYNSYEDAQGQKRYITDIRVLNFLILDKRDNNAPAEMGAVQAPESESTDNDGLPF